MMEAAAQKQLELFAANLPNKPFCSDNLDYGLQIRAAKTAIEKRYIQHNKPTTIQWLAFDCDYAGAIEDSVFNNMPQPNIAVINKANGHSHLLYGLEVGVHRTHVARQKPLLYVAKIEAALRAGLKADIGYSGLIVKNPLNAHWLTVLERPDSYTLNELADYLTLPAKLTKRQYESGLGRNCTLFDTLRKWAYSQVMDYRISKDFEGFKYAVACQANILNCFPSPLPTGEVISTAKSISKWTWNQYTGRMPNAQFSQLQAGRQTRQVAARNTASKPLKQAALAMYEAGNTQAQIALALGKTQQTISNWLRPLDI